MFKVLFNFNIQNFNVLLQKNCLNCIWHDRVNCMKMEYSIYNLSEKFIYIQWTSLTLILRTKWWINHHWSREVTLMKVSSGQGIVKPPIGWSNPNSSSDLLRRAWNEGWFKYEIGTTYLFFWLSPTYTARNPFGAAEAALLLVAAAAVTERPKIFFALNILLTKAIYVSFVWKIEFFWTFWKCRKDFEVIGILLVVCWLMIERMGNVMCIYRKMNEWSETSLKIPWNLWV